ncbi:MAG: hypothetical protein PHQ11_17100, partial [Paludibacter sp.]|nr:hypothetical protein [Paludibacter sp.]
WNCRKGEIEETRALSASKTTLYPERFPGTGITPPLTGGVSSAPGLASGGQSFLSWALSSRAPCGTRSVSSETNLPGD